MSDAIAESGKTPSRETTEVPAEVSPFLLRVLAFLRRRLEAGGDATAGPAPLDELLHADPEEPYAHLRRTFGLRRQDEALLLCALGLSLEPELAGAFARLQDGRPHATEALAARLFGLGRRPLWDQESPLRLWRMLRAVEAAPAEPPAFVCDPVLREWLWGLHPLDSQLQEIARILPAPEPLETWPIDSTLELARKVVQETPGGRVRIQVVGLPGSGRRSFAAAISARLSLPLLGLHAEAMEPEAFRQAWLLANRHAFLERMALAWSGNAACEIPWPAHAAAFPVQFLILEEGQNPPPAADGVDFRVALPFPGSADRRKLWHRHLPASRQWGEKDMAPLLENRALLPGQIAATALSRPGNAADALEALHEASRGRLGVLAQKMRCPFQWDDLVLPDGQKGFLRDLVFEAQERHRFWEQPRTQRLFPQGRGLLALFSGAPGTGKTMAAQVIAAELRRDLFRIDLSAVISKYVGETAKNLESILSRARRMDVVLFFDEADTLFAKRTEIKDAHDRFANADTNYLLQAIETYEGVVLLSTNKKGHVDAAFLRRARYLVEFPKPDAAQRLQLWTRLVEELAGEERQRHLRPTLEALATHVESTGAQIKFSLLAALFAARQEDRPLDLGHLLKGLDRELGKEGRLLSEREKGRINPHGR